MIKSNIFGRGREAISRNFFYIGIWCIIKTAFKWRLGNLHRQKQGRGAWWFFGPDWQSLRRRWWPRQRHRRGKRPLPPSGEILDESRSFHSARHVLGVLHHDTRVLFRCSAFSENQLSPKTKRESSLTLYTYLY